MVADCGRGSCFIVDGDLTCKCEAGYKLFSNYPKTACINVNKYDDAAIVVVNCCNQGTRIDIDGNFS